MMWTYISCLPKSQHIAIMNDFVIQASVAMLLSHHDNQVSSSSHHFTKRQTELDVY